MKNTIKLLAAASLISFTLINCSKERIQPEPNTYASLNEFYEAYKQPEQEYIITQDGQCPLIAQNGLKLCLGRNQLTMQNGDSVDLPYTIKIVELYTAKDMLLYNMPTMSGDDLLTTGGEIRVRAFKGTEELLLRSGHSYLAQVPATNPTTQMDVFYGVESNSMVDWLPDTIASNIAIDTSNAFYNLTLGFLNWINCDYFYNVAQKTQVDFTSTTDDLTNVGIFMWFPNANGLMKVYNMSTDDVPLNEPVKIVCIARDASGNMYSFYQETTTSANMTLNVTMAQTTENDIITLLDNL